MRAREREARSSVFVTVSCFLSLQLEKTIFILVDASSTRAILVFFSFFFSLLNQVRSPAWSVGWQEEACVGYVA